MNLTNWVLPAPRVPTRPTVQGAVFRMAWARRCPNARQSSRLSRAIEHSWGVSDTSWIMALFFELFQLFLEIGPSGFGRFEFGGDFRHFFVKFHGGLRIARCHELFVDRFFLLIEFGDIFL